jgi:hypothetical protein
VINSVWINGSGATAYRNGNNVVVQITDGGASGGYNVGISLQNVVNLNSTVLYQTGSGLWASGTLADERRDVGSILALGSNRKIYFTTRDNKMWYYEFSNGLGKWDAVPVPSVTNAKVVPNGYSDVVAIGNSIYYLDGSNRIYYVENGSNSPFGSVPLYATKLYTPTNSFNTGLFYRQPDGVIKYGTSSTNIIGTDDERFLVDNNTIYYAKGGYLYKATIGNAASETQLVSGKTILNGTDLEFYGAYLYFIGSDKALYRFNVATKILDNALTPIGYCEGQFAINPQGGVVYIKTKDPNTSYHRVGQVYQQGNTWLVKNATTSVNDYMDGDIVFSNPNVFYLTTRSKPSTVGENINSIWNLYFYDECTPAVFRKGDEEQHLEISNLEAEQILAYPNPFADELQVLAEKGQTIQLFDQLGRLVREQMAESNSTTLSTESLVKGMYVLKISQNGEVLNTQKLVK